MNRTVKRQRTILSDDSSASITSTGSSDSSPLTIFSAVQVVANRLRRQRSTSTSSSSESTTLLPLVKSKSDHNKRLKKGTNKIDEDALSADTAELVKSILQHQPSESRLKKQRSDNLPTGDDKGIGIDLTFRRSHTTSCGVVDVDIQGDESSKEDNQSNASKSLNKDSPGPSFSSPIKRATAFNDADGESVETAELVRRICQPLEHVPTLAAATCRTTNVLRPDPPFKDICFSAKEAYTINSDVTVTAIKLDVYGSANNISKAVKLDEHKHSNAEDEFVLPDEFEDEFVLPEQSDTSDDYDSDENDNNIMDACNTNTSSRTMLRPQSYAAGAVDVRRQHAQQGKNQVLSSMETFHTSRSIHDLMPGPSPFVDNVNAESIENAAFGFSPEKRNTGTRDNHFYSEEEAIGRQENIDQSINYDYRSVRHQNSQYDSLPNNVVRQGLRSCRKMFSPGILQNSGYGIGLERNPTRISIGARDDQENIENFSDDDYDQAFGFGKVASSLLERRQSSRTGSSTIDNVTDRKSRLRQYIASSKAPFVRQSHIENFATREIDVDSNIDSGILASKRHTLQNQGLLNYGKNVTVQNGQVQPPINSSAEFKPDVMDQYNVQQRPRRIRDASVRSISLHRQPSTLSPINPFSLYTNTENKASVTVKADTASCWERNDVFGGSGVGAGSYQIHKQRGKSKTDEVSVVEVNSNIYNEDDTPLVVSNTRRPSSKSRTFKKTSVAGGSKATGKKTNRGGSRGGGRRGKGGWKKKGKQRSRGTGSASSQNSRHNAATGSTWAGNTDDPQLRHVGGAEMSF